MLRTLVPPDVQQECERHLVDHSCTVDGQFLPVWGTSAATIGEVTSSVGVELYFHFVKRAGVLFLILFLISLPMFVMNVMGGMISSPNALQQALASTSVANLGHCPEKGCRSLDDLKYRCLSEVGDCLHDGSKTKVRDVTEALGFLDGVTVLAFMIFAIYSVQFWIPRVVYAFDQAHLTPADYSVNVVHAPRVLAEDLNSEEHAQYEQKLRKHFVDLLRARLHGDEEVSDDAVVQVALVRDYDNAIETFKLMGNHQRDVRNAESLREIYRESNTGGSNDRKIAKVEKTIARSHEQINQLRRKLDRQAEVRDEQRPVFQAFVTFSHTKYQEEVVHAYRFARLGFFRWCLPPQLRFEGAGIICWRAPEPSDIFWENMDYSPGKRCVRRICAGIATLLTLFLCGGLLLLVKSSTTTPLVPEFKTWVIERYVEDETVSNPNITQCVTGCRWDFYSTYTCTEPGIKVGEAQGRAKLFSATTDVDLAEWNGTYGGNEESCADPMQSSACDPHGDPDDDWIGVEFKDRQSVLCIRLTQNVEYAVPLFRIWGCHGGIAKLENRSEWRPEDHCLPMQVVRANNEKQNDWNTGIDSGDLHVAVEMGCAAEVSLEAAQMAKERGDRWSVHCYCMKTLQRHPGLITPPYESPEQLVCEDWGREQAKVYGFLAAGVTAVCVLNIVLLSIFTLFIKMEKHCTMTGLMRSQLSKLFPAQFINTGLLIYLVNARFGEVPTVYKTITEPFSLGKGAFYEANGDWFAAVGTSLFVTIFSQALSTTITPFIQSKIVLPLLRFKVLYFSGKVTKESLKSLYLLPEWDIALRLAQSMNIICCILFYSGGMPILYLVGAVYCMLAYWLDKYSLLRGSRRPPAYSENLLEHCLNWAPVAAFMHTIFACGVLSNQIVFPSPWSILREPLEGLLMLDHAEYDRIMQAWEYADDGMRAIIWSDFLHARWLDFARKGTSLLLIVFLCCMLYYGCAFLYWFLLKPFLHPIVALCACCWRTIFFCPAKREKEESNRPWAEAVKLMHGVTEYTMKGNHRYRNAAEAIACTADMPALRTLRAAEAVGGEDVPEQPQTDLEQPEGPSATEEKTVTGSTLSTI